MSLAIGQNQLERKWELAMNHPPSQFLTWKSLLGRSGYGHANSPNHLSKTTGSGSINDDRKLAGWRAWCELLQAWYQGHKNTNGSQTFIWFPFHFIATVVARKRQATVGWPKLDTGVSGFLSAVRRIGQLACPHSGECWRCSTVHNVHRVFRYTAMSVLNLLMCLLQRIWYSSQQSGPKTGGTASIPG